MSNDSERASFDEIQTQAKAQEELDGLFVQFLNDELKSDSEEYRRVEDRWKQVKKAVAEAEQKNKADGVAVAGSGLEAALPRAWVNGFRNKHILELPHAHATKQTYACAMVAAQLSYCLDEGTVDVDEDATADERRSAFLKEALQSFLRVRLTCQTVAQVKNHFEPLYLVCKTEFDPKRPLGVAPTVILKHKDNGGKVRLFVASRGSSTAADWEFNFKRHPVPWKPSQSSDVVQVHAGFKMAAEAQHESQEDITDEVKKSLAKATKLAKKVYDVTGISTATYTLALPEALDEAVKATNPAEIVFCGHSLGGAVSLLHAVKHTTNGWQPAVPIRLVTFACPRVGDQALVNLTNEKIKNNVRVFHEGDAVPAIPSEYLDKGFKVYAGHPGSRHVQISGWGNPSTKVPGQTEPKWGSAPRWGAVQKAHRYHAVAWGVVTYHSLLCYATAFWYNLTEDGAFPPDS